MAGICTSTASAGSQKTDDTRYTVAKAEWDKGLSRLKYATQTLADDIPTMGRRPRIGRSRLGAYYPADYWL